MSSFQPVSWPDNKRFAFTIFDDPDSQTLRNSQTVYHFLADLGIYTTKGVWPLAPRREPSDHGVTCGDPDYRKWLQIMQERGLEMGYHNATSHSSTREETIEGLDLFRSYFGSDPVTMSNHYYCEESVYFGAARLSGWRRAVYLAATRGQKPETLGHVPGQPYFWGDVCQQRIRYCRNFVFRNINTLAECPQMPYYNPAHPYVKGWYASSEGANVRSGLEMLSEANQDRLEEEGGACILYVHFGHGYVDDTKLEPRFVELMKRLAQKGGWFVPVEKLLGHLAPNGPKSISPADLARMERRWLVQKLRYGTS